MVGDCDIRVGDSRFLYTMTLFWCTAGCSSCCSRWDDLSGDINWVGSRVVAPATFVERRAGCVIGFLFRFLPPAGPARRNSGAQRLVFAPICLHGEQLGGVEACFRPRNHHLSDTTDMLSHCRATKHPFAGTGT